jgi:hypothetical protein
MRWVAKPDTCDRFACLSNEELSDIVNNGANALDHYGYERRLRRLRQSCYLDEDNAPLTPQQRLMELYRTDGLVLFLGAGVSRGSEYCRIPNWEGLSESMLKEVGAPPPSVKCQ